MLGAFANDARLTPPSGGFTRYQVTAGVAAIRAAPEPDAEMLTQALGGEIVRVFREAGEFAQVQLERDGYVGWALMAALSAPVDAPTHSVIALRTYVFSEPSIKSAPHFMLCWNARLSVVDEQDRFFRLARFGFVVKQHAGALTQYADDPAGVAEAYLHTPYLWGGVESLGLDCSGLVQMAFQACGVTLPRDTDMQAAWAGEPIGDWRAPGALRRNDLVFWKGHVGIMLDPDTLLHANAHHMATAREPLAEAISRIGALYGMPTGARRLETAALKGKRPSWLQSVLGERA